MENRCLCKLSEQMLGTKYKISKDVGKGTISRIIIDEGLEIAHWDSSATMEWSYDNERDNSNVIEISYCCSGSAEIDTFPNNKKYTIKKGDIAFYGRSDSVEHFKFSYKDLIAVSIHIDLDVIKGSVNPLWEEKAIIEWKELMDNIFSHDILNIEKAPYNIKIIAEEIRDINIESMMDYMKLKCKAIELFMLCLQHKSSKNYNISNFTKDEVDIIYNAETILLDNLRDPPSVYNLAKNLNITVYKLQKGFKEITGSTVYEYIRKARVERGKIFLKSTDMQIICIANKVGYENPSKFSSVFKSYTGMTPSEYRNRKLY